MNRESRGLMDGKEEESYVIWKEAPESRIHGDVLDCGGGGRFITELAEPVEEEPEAASRPCRTISCAVRDATKEVDVEAQVPQEEPRHMCCFFL